MKNKTRLIYVVSHGISYASNGYAIRTHGIAKSLIQSGVDVICFVRPGRPWQLAGFQGDVTLDTTIDGVRYVHTKCRDILGARLDEDIAKLATIYHELFHIFKPDYVLAASNFEVGIPSLLAAKRLNIPFAYEIRGFWEITQASIEPSYMLTAEYQLRFAAEQWLVQQKIKLFTLNEAMKDELIQRGAKAQAINLVPNGLIELPAVENGTHIKARLNIAADCFVFGYVGSLLSYEGLDDLLKALVLLPRELSWCLLLVGATIPLQNSPDTVPKGYSAEIHRLVVELNLESRVHFTGRVDHSDVAYYYAAIDCLVIPRKPWPVCQLVMPLKGIEGLSYGKKLLVSDVAPLKSLQQISETVTVFTAGDITSLSMQLMCVYHQSLSIEQQNLIRRDVWESFRYSKVVQPILTWCKY